MARKNKSAQTEARRIYDLVIADSDWHFFAEVANDAKRPEHVREEAKGEKQTRYEIVVSAELAKLDANTKFAVMIELNKIKED